MSNNKRYGVKIDGKLAVPPRIIHWLSRERLRLIELARFQAHIGNAPDGAIFLDSTSNAYYRLVALLSCLFDEATLFDVGTGGGYTALALSYHPHNHVISYDLKACSQLEASDALANVEFHVGDACRDGRLADARLVVLNSERGGAHELAFYRHLKRIKFNGLLLLPHLTRRDTVGALWDEIELPKEDLSELGHPLSVGLVDFSGTAPKAADLKMATTGDPIYAADQIRRSFVIPVLDLSPHSRFNIVTLLEDLEKIAGEVICVFNSPDVYEDLKHHPRIDKYCFNNLNAGVGRSWNMGIDLAEGDAVFVMNADLHVGRTAIEDLEAALYSLPNAVLVGPHGSLVDFETLKVMQYFYKGSFGKPVQTHDVSGFFFCLHLERFLAKGLRFDPRYSPCFMEEWDMALQVLQAGLACYAIPTGDFDHDWGVSANNTNPEIVYFGRTMRRNDILSANHRRFREKWFPN
jgi:hypothetical protein